MVVFGDQFVWYLYYCSYQGAMSADVGTHHHGIHDNLLGYKYYYQHSVDNNDHQEVTQQKKLRKG